jgi:ABC-2 type transport system ATP-binding protein
VTKETDPVIDVRGLRRTYPGGVEAVRDIEVDVAPGEVFGLLGPDGAAKSTTVGTLTTTIAPTAAAPAWPATTWSARHSTRAA